MSDYRAKHAKAQRPLIDRDDLTSWLEDKERNLGVMVSNLRGLNFGQTPACKQLESAIEELIAVKRYVYQMEVTER